VVEDFSTNLIALIGSDANQNCIRSGIVDTKYCERTYEQLLSAGSLPLSIRCKLKKGYIRNNNYCFKNVFLIDDNIANDIISVHLFLYKYILFMLMNRVSIQVLWVDPFHSNFLLQFDKEKFLYYNPTPFF